MKKQINKLKVIRVSLGIIITTLLTAFFIDISGVLPHQLHTIAHLQLFPAILFAVTGKVIYLVITLLLVFLFGRLYCSIICPLGVMQDFISWVAKKKNKKKKYKYTKPFNIVRYILLILTIVLVIIGAGGLAGIIEPYSIYGRIATHIFKPILIYINNLLALFFEWTGDYYFLHMDLTIISLSFVIATISLIIVGIFAFIWGRKFCNIICPVGALLSLLARFSLYKIRINKDKCNNCGLCAMGCKSQCINITKNEISIKEDKIDIGNCVVCFNCVSKCNKGAISFKLRKNA